MNASDDEKDQQRSIEAKDSLDRKIAQSPSPYAWASGAGGKGACRDDEVVVVKSKDVSLLDFPLVYTAEISISFLLLSNI